MEQSASYNWTFSCANATLLSADSVICGFRLSGMYEVLDRWLYYILLFSLSPHPEMANRTNKPNRTFSRSCSVCSSSAPHRTEPNSVLVRFVFGRFSNIDVLVRFGFCKFELCQAKSRVMCNMQWTNRYDIDGTNLRHVDDGQACQVLE